MNNTVSRSQIKEAINLKLSRYYGITPAEASSEQIYKATVLTVKDILAQKKSETFEAVRRQRAKRVYYMCMEFLVGRSLRNNLMNLGIAEDYKAVLSEFGFDLDSLYELEPDAGLGNGGLGRLAVCYLDALTSNNYPVTGFSICYEFGLFKQKIVDGMQIELPDIWMPGGDVWLVPRTDKSVTVRMGGHVNEEWKDDKLDISYEGYDEVQAIPYDMFISGASETVNVLRLWRAQSPPNFNIKLFSQGEYLRAVEDNTSAEIISKVLYPSDNHTEGKLLRLTQQYFLVSASLQCIITDHLAVYGTISNLCDKVAIHLNDTHPALCIPELMRILMDTYSYSWERAWEVVRRIFSYTNHTVMPEALEEWNEDLFKLKLPRIHQIVSEINRRFCADLWTRYPGDWDRISRMAVVANNHVRMANLSVIGSYRVNGVSELHSEILKKTVFRDFYKLDPAKFTNVTNGITHRRWLCYVNPELAGLLDESIGREYRTDASKLGDFVKYYDDTAILERLGEIKHNNKKSFADYVKQKTGVAIDPDSLYDVQIKRLHEYKRQLLNTLRIISLYNRLLENPNLEIQPRTFIFGAKAAQGYHMAKETIRLIWSLSREIENNPKIREKLRVVFMEDYNVSIAEHLIPASDISEQLSLAGKEASGTGNMKFMINGAITVGTLDGANVEIKEAVGDSNIFIFGLDKDEVEDLWRRGYDARSYYNTSTVLMKAVDRLAHGFNGSSFEYIMRYLIANQHGVCDPFMCLADFDSYCAVHDIMDGIYTADRRKWLNMSLINIASAGRFAADRSVREYAEDIWNFKPVTKGAKIPDTARGAGKR
ncbi:MAG: glycogen/starch/alpha-glucan phosphorylase [Clostridiales bacterium]|nr:glycogen/starch/alpha-glucan phosphorylase [Clostridiales bacterium]